LAEGHPIHPLAKQPEGATAKGLHVLIEVADDQTYCFFAISGNGQPSQHAERVATFPRGERRGSSRNTGADRQDLFLFCHRRKRRSVFGRSRSANGITPGSPRAGNGGGANSVSLQSSRHRSRRLSNSPSPSVRNQSPIWTASRS